MQLVFYETLTNTMCKYVIKFIRFLKQNVNIHIPNYYSYSFRFWAISLSENCFAESPREGDFFFNALCLQGKYMSLW